jgi:hypothetical protein
MELVAGNLNEWYRDVWEKSQSSVFKHNIYNYTFTIKLYI